jgi:hypothetical protein
MKIYAVDLISKSIQRKLVYASSKFDAVEIAKQTDWMEKEEMLESEIEVRKAVINGDEEEGEYPDFYPSDYVFVKDGEAKRYSEL